MTSYVLDNLFNVCNNFNYDQFVVKIKLKGLTRSVPRIFPKSKKFPSKKTEIFSLFEGISNDKLLDLNFS